MCKKTIRLILVTAIGALVGFGCWGGGPSRVVAPGIASDAGEQAIAQFDTNKDGKISGTELDKAPGLKAAAKIFDPQAKGITAEMINTRVKAWQESKLGRQSIAYRVTRRGQPLSGATVTLVPEKFLGSQLQPAKGTTDASGTAMITVPTTGPDDPPGVPPGMYRVEITKSNEIPAKYNTQTIIGQEIAQDALGMQEGMKCDLDY